uniref:hypothetical protein n=1 Tax=Ningiella ruwaisensis TaxID=2364274 RepID=UPI00109FC5C5|nr:hypothetical protein [Ningiella ruwaisensis]
MSNHSQWNPECIRQRFEIVKTEVIEANTRTRKTILVLLISILLLFVGVFLYKLFVEKDAGYATIGTFVGIFFLFFAIIYITINASEKCVSKLSICLLTIDDRHQFFRALEQVSCGGAAIEHFMQFTDKATNIINAVNPNGNGGQAAPQNLSEQNTARHPSQGAQNHAK